MILLTGGAGFVGLNVAEQLLDRGEEIVLFDLKPPPAPFPPVAFFQGGAWTGTGWTRSSRVIR